MEDTVLDFEPRYVPDGKGGREIGGYVAKTEKYDYTIEMFGYEQNLEGLGKRFEKTVFQIVLRRDRNGLERTSVREVVATTLDQSEAERIRDELVEIIDSESKFKHAQNYKETSRHVKKAVRKEDDSQ